MSALDALASRIDEIAPLVMAEHRIPGAAVVAVDGDTEVIRCYGVRDVDAKTPVDVDTLFQVGSVTKTVTATLLQQLVVEGRLDLDAPLRRYLPTLALAAADLSEQVTTRHLLAHVAGFEGDLFVDTGDGNDALERFVAQLDRAPQIAPFGWTHSYCNAGYSLLGRVIEVLRETPFEAAAQSLVLEPLGMSRTAFAWMSRPENCTTGHVVHDGRALAVRPWTLFRSIAPAGALVSSARDLASYARFHLGTRDASILSRDALEAMRRPLYDAAISPNAVGWSTSRAGALALIGHGGSTVSHIAQLTLAPERAFAFAILTNADRGGALVRALTCAILVDHLGPPPPSSPHYVTPDARSVVEYAGRYRAAIYDVAAGADGEGVWLDARRVGGMDAHQSPRPEPLPRMRLDFVAPDRAVIRNGPFTEQPVWFARDHDRRVRWVKFFGRLTRKLPE
jgi:CubicO group peptidase (beta-lactamase class C family)